MVSKLQLLYKDNRILRVSARLSRQPADDDPRARELELQGAMKEIKRAAAVVVAESSKRGLDASKVQKAELDF